MEIYELKPYEVTGETVIGIDFLVTRGETYLKHILEKTKEDCIDGSCIIKLGRWTQRESIARILGVPDTSKFLV